MVTELGAPNPSEWPGELGQEFIVPEDKQTYDKYFKYHEFNVLASDRIALNRTLQDSRNQSCLTKQYRNRLPTASVIIVFHNEAYSTLLRTLHSVIKTSSNLLLEIILVDDFSTKTYLRHHLKHYVKGLSVTTKIMRLGRRSGLIKARLLGSSHAKGQVLVFLDSHCECNEGWLEPLLDRIAEDRTRVVGPAVDIINENHFGYLMANQLIGGFNWKIAFRWYPLPNRELIRRNYDQTIPIRSPTLSGGLFAIDRDFFEYIGKYDPKMIIWGAENVEFSLRVWMCGGSIEIVTCSRVGHVFRYKTPYSLPGGSTYIVWHNTARLVDVWLDEWKDFFYGLHSGARRIDIGSTDQRVAFRQQRQCKSFRWYLDNIYPESHLPKDYNFLGDIKNLETEYYCLDTLQSSDGTLVMNHCHLSHTQHISFGQLFVYNKDFSIRNDEECLDVSRVNQHVIMEECHHGHLNQMWTYDANSFQLIHMNTNSCLDTVSNEHMSQLVIKECLNDKKSQKWLLSDNYEWQLAPHLPQL